MSNLSKYYNTALKSASCKAILHPDRTCCQFAKKNFGTNFLVIAKFYAPIVCIQFLRQIEGFSREGFRNAFKQTFQTCFLLTLTTYLGGACGQSITCILNHMLGRMYISTSVFIPSFLGNFWGFLMPNKIINYISNGITLLLVEAYFRNGSSVIWRSINSSKLVRTFMFMSMSACILDTRNIVKEDIFWFIKPIPPTSPLPDEPIKSQPSKLMDRFMPTTIHSCAHTGPCDSYILKGIKANVKLGLGLEIARLFLSNMSVLQRSPSQVFRLITDVKLEVILFFVSYTTGYRFLNCSLNRYYKKPSDWANTMAAFLSAATFYMYPNLTILSHATLTSAKLLWTKFLKAASMNPGTKKISDIFEWLPLARIFFVLTTGYVFHLRSFYPWMCPSLLLRAVNHTSGNNCDDAITRLGYFLFGNT